jgi:hypothetical protein
MGTNNNIVHDLETLLETEPLNSNPENAKRFENAMVRFKEMVDRGLIQEKGNQLMTAENAHLYRANTRINRS